MIACLLLVSFLLRLSAPIYVFVPLLLFLNVRGPWTINMSLCFLYSYCASVAFSLCLGILVLPLALLTTRRLPASSSSVIPSLVGYLGVIIIFITECIVIYTFFPI